MADDIDVMAALPAELALEELLRGCPRNHPKFEATLRAELRRNYAKMAQLNPVEAERERARLLATAPRRH